MESFTKRDAQNMLNDIREAMAAIEKKYNCTLSIGKSTYGDYFETKLSFGKTVQHDNGSFVQTKESQAFAARAKSLGVSEDVLGQEIRHEGKTYVVLGYATKNRMYPILYTINGKRYKGTVDAMKAFVKSGRPEFFL